MAKNSDEIIGFSNYQDNFPANSFAPFNNLSPPDSPEKVITNFQTCAKVESYFSLWEFLPTIDLNSISSSYLRHRCLDLIRNLLASNHLEPQQKSVLEKTVLYYSNRNPNTKFSRIFFRHILTLLLVCASMLFSFYLSIFFFLLVVSIAFFQLKVIQIFTVISINSTFSQVLLDIARLENVLKEFSNALKLLKQIHVVQKAFFTHQAQSFQYNYTHLANLKQCLTGSYYEIFTSLQTKSDFLSMRSSGFRRDEMICTLSVGDILCQIYKENGDNVNDLDFESMSLDSFKMWHCLVTCQYSEYLEIFVKILYQNLLLPQPHFKQLHFIQNLRSKGIFQDSEYEDGYLDQLVYLTKSDVFSSDLNANNPPTNASYDERDNCDKIDLILQCCIFKLRKLKDMGENEREAEIQFLKLNLENALDGVKNLTKSSCVETNIPTSFSQYKAEGGNDSAENELILPKSNALEVPDSIEVVYEGVSLAENISRNDLFYEKEDQSNFDTAATKSVLRELKCVLANKSVKNKSENEAITTRVDTPQDTMRESLEHTDTDAITNSTASSPTRICENTDSQLKDRTERLLDQNLINLAILNSGRSMELEQTVIGDHFDSD